MEVQIVKAGWMYRISSVLHRWKKNWFVLYRTGELSYYESQDSHEPIERFVLCAVCTGIKTGFSCDMSPPEGRSKVSLLHLIMRQDDLKLCAESPDDMKAWQIALEEARVINRSGNSNAQVPLGAQVMYPQAMSGGYYPGHVITAPGQYVVPNAATGSSMVVLGNAPGQVVCMRQRRYDPYVSGPMFYGPVLWW